MRQLVGQQVGQRAVADDHRRGQKGQAGVLHPAVGEGRRQDEHVVAFPGIGPVELLGLGQHVLDLGELPGGGFDQVGLGVDA
jgi:hypothetical protein